MRNFLIALHVSSTLSLLGQTQQPISVVIKKLYAEQKYSEVIQNYGHIKADTSATANYYVGLSYYNNGDYENSIKHFDYSTYKDPEKWESFYMKAQLLNSLERYEEAKTAFQKAALTNKKDSYIYSGLGDANYALGNNQEALDAYKKAITLESPLDHTYLMIAEVYKALGNQTKTLEAYYTAKENVAKDTEAYFLLLDNIGAHEMNDENYKEAYAIYYDLHIKNRNNYYYVTKLIQASYGLKKYNYAASYKKTLYDAKQKGLLSEKLSELFCFDQFSWNGKKIFAYEYYDEHPEKANSKFVFYLIDTETQEIEKQIHTKQSENKKAKHEYGDLVTMNKDKIHAVYQIKYKNSLEDYDCLKTTVLNVLEDKQTPINTTFIR